MFERSKYEKYTKPGINMSPFRMFVLFFPFISFCEKMQGQRPQLILPIGHTADIRSAEFSPDGKKIFAQSNDNTIKIWDAQSGKLLINFIDFFKENSFDHTSAIFSPDGKKMVTGFLDITATVWNTETGRPLFRLEGHNDLIGAIVFSPDGKKILTKSNEQKAIIWDAQTGKKLVTLNGLPEELEEVTLIDFSPDGTKVLFSLQYEPDQVWDVNTGKKLYEPDGSSSFSPDSKMLVTSGSESTVKICDAQNGKMLGQLVGHTKQVYSAEFNPDGTKIVTVSHDSTVKIWDTRSGKLLHSLFGYNYEIYSAEFSPDGTKIITGCSDSLSKIWDVNTGTLLFSLNDKSLSMFNASEFSSDSRKIVSLSGNKTAKIFDSETGKLLQTLVGHSGEVTDAHFSPDDKKIMTVSYDKTIKIWDTETGELLTDLKGHTSSFNLAQYSEDGKYIFISGYGLKMRNAQSGNYVYDQDRKVVDTWDAATGKLITDLKNIPGITAPPALNEFWEDHFEFQGSVLLTDLERPVLGDHRFIESPDGKKIIHKSHVLSRKNEDTVQIRDAGSRSISVNLADPSDNFIGAVFSPDGKKILTSFSFNKAKVWDTETGKLLTALKDLEEDIETAIFSPDGKRIFVASATGDAAIWDTKTGIRLANLKGHFNRINSAVFSPDRKYIVTTSEDNTNKKWNAATGELLYTFFKIDSIDYLLIDKKGNYSGTPAAAKWLSWKKDKKVYDFDQWDIQYNRPDKLLQATGNKDTLLTNAYHRAWQKRISRLKIDTTMFRDDYHVPEAIITNNEQIEGTTNTNKVDLKIHLYETDKTAYLKKIYITINDNPLLGRFGKDISGKKISDTTFSFPVLLCAGENHIKVSCLNNRSAESLRQSVHVRYKPNQEDTARSTTYFIGIGIKEFADTTHNLQYCVKDIRDLEDSLKKKTKEAFVVIDTLYNENVNVKNIKDLKQKLRQTKEEDKVIIAYSGHGLLSKNFDYYLSTFPVNFKQPEKDGLAYDNLENLLDSIPARKKLMLIDACYSGELDKEELMRIEAAKKDLDETISVKGGETIADSSNLRLGMKNTFELMQQLFANVGKSTGATIISAAAGTQFARESGELKNSVFTYCILEAMQNHSLLKVSELKRIVGQRVEELTKGLQKPTSRNETNNFDWEIW